MLKMDDVSFYTSLNNLNSKNWPFTKECSKNIKRHYEGDTQTQVGSDKK